MEQELKLPRKSLFKVEELCGLTGVKPYVLRFWETEFSEISPLISASGQKFYEVKDIKVVSLIKRMLFDEKMTIQEAKSKLQERIRDRMRSAQQEQQSKQAEATNKVQHTEQRIEEKESAINFEEMASIKEILGEMLRVTKEIRANHNWS